MKKWKKKYKATVIPIQAEKGGVGKTTIAVNLSTRLAEHYGKRVLLIDLDEQCNAGFDLGLSTEDVIRIDSMGKSCSKLFTDRHIDMKELVLSGLVPEIPNLSFISSTFRLMFTERMLQDESKERFEPAEEDLTEEILTEYPKLKNVFKDYSLCRKVPPLYPEASVLRDTFNNNASFLNQFDYVILDCKPSISHINENALAVADSLIAVTDPSYNSMLGIETFYNFWDRQKKSIGLETDYEESVVLNRFRQRGAVDRQIEAILKGDYEYKDLPEYAKELFEGYDELYIDLPIPENVRFKQRSGLAVPLVVSPDRDERKLIEDVMDPLIIKLTERGIL